MTPRVLGPAAILATLLAAPASAQCPDQTLDVFEAQGFTVNRVIVSGPLLNGSMLRDDVVGPIVKAGSSLRKADVDSGRAALRQYFLRIPALFDSPVAATVVTADVDACDATTKRLDVVYLVFTTKVPLALSRTFESRDAESRDPASRLAMAAAPVHYQFTPLVRYNALEHVVAGGRAAVKLPGAIDSLEAEVTASDVVLNADLELTGSREPGSGFTRRLEWRGGYHRHERPTGDPDEHETREEKFALQLTALSRPLGSFGAVLRGSTQFEGGHADTDFATTDLPAAYRSDAGYGTWKSTAGATFRSRRYAWSATYGLQLGFTSGGDAVDFVKSVGDLAYDGHFAFPGADHYPLDVSARFGAGRISGDAGIPAAERFFGGNVAAPLLAGEEWDARATPVIRSFPAFSFSDPGNGGVAGGDYFLSYNLTTSIPVWIKPLVPREVTDDDFIRQSIDGMFTSGESFLETLYKISDPAHQRAVDASSPLKGILESIDARVQELLPTLSGARERVAERCQEQVETFMDTVDAISPKTYVGKLLSEPVDEDDATLPSVIRACVDAAGSSLADAALAKSGSALVAARTAIAAQIGHIDAEAAHRQAVREMRTPRETVATVLDEMNAVAIGPLFVFDAARLGQYTAPSSHLTRYAVGTGVGLTLASSFRFSAGYVWNTNRSPTERRGAAFATIELTTLLGR